jgi:hypothetical protein
MLAPMVKRLAAMGVVACFLSLGMFSCKRPNPPKGVVFAHDSAGAAVSGATVKLTSTGDKGAGILKATGTTDGSGKAYFNDFTLDAILNVTCTKVITAGDTLKGTGILKLVTGEETDADISMK